jgi:hypothetical protein
MGFRREPGRRSVLCKLLGPVSHRPGHVTRPSLLPLLRKEGQAATFARPVGAAPRQQGSAYLGV